MANIGKSISIKGNVTGDEDTVIEGRVDGHVELKNHHLTVGPNGDVKGEISAKQCTIVGTVQGNVTAVERIEVADTGRIEGDLVSPRLLIQEGAQVNGSISMQPATEAKAQPQAQTSNGKKAEKPAARITPEPQQSI
jgi:cytoskeletal protein CcmA (bactofilin family)